MAYSVPTFNLTCNIWNQGAPAWPVLSAPSGSPRIAGQICGLAHGRLSAKVYSIGGNFIEAPIAVMSLLLPKGTDVRGLEVNFAGSDIVECPAGSHRFYAVSSVDDVGKGFANEYRLAYMLAVTETWTPPYP